MQAISPWDDVAFSSTEGDRHLGIRPVSQLNTWPAVSPVNASRRPSRDAAHHSGSGRMASPYPTGTFTSYSLPAFLAHSAWGAFATETLTLWPGSIFKRRSNTSNGRNATPRQHRLRVPGRGPQQRLPQLVAWTSVGQSTNLDSRVRDRWLLENRSGLSTQMYGRALLQRSEHGLSAPANSCA
jgi:hypothetical protein